MRIFLYIWCNLNAILFELSFILRNIICIYEISHLLCSQAYACPNEFYFWRNANFLIIASVQQYLRQTKFLLWRPVIWL